MSLSCAHAIIDVIASKSELVSLNHTLIKAECVMDGLNSLGQRGDHLGKVENVEQFVVVITFTQLIMLNNTISLG